MLLTALPPALTADILVIPDLEEVQEEDFVLQVAAPPRYVTLGVKLQGGRGQVASHTPVPAPVLLPPVQTHMLLVTAPRPPPPRAPSSLGMSFPFWAFPGCLGGSGDGGPAALLELVLPVVPPHIPSVPQRPGEPGDDLP